MTIERLQKKIINFLLIILPYHYFVFSILLSGASFLTLYRDIAILLLVILQLYKNPKIRNIKLFINILVVILYMLVMVLKSPNLAQAITIFRVYIMPLILLWSVCSIQFSKTEIIMMTKQTMVNAVIIGLYGIIQAYILGADYLISLGYSTSSNGNLSASLYLSSYAGGIFGRGIQRINSTFSAANMCCFYMCCIFIFVYFIKDELNISKMKKRVILLFLVLIILLTFSRSSWLALGIVLIAVFIKKRKISKKVLQYIFLVIFLLVICLIAARNTRIVSGILHVISSSFSGSDTSMNSHFETIASALNLIKNNFGGLGFGNNGPRALSYGNSNLVESSYLLMCFEIGVIGAILYFMPYILLFFDKRKDDSISMKQIRRYLLAFVFICFFNIPFIQEYECMAIFAIFVGLTYHQNNWKGEKK